MPFTLAHPAAVLPLRRIGLPLSAMVAGSMAPDVTTFYSGNRGYSRTHSLTGIVTVDILISLVGLWLWYVVVRDLIVDLVPWVRHRVDEHVRWSGRDWLLAIPAAAVGAATHVLWDSFTHPGRWGADHVPVLLHQAGRYPVATWGQYLSGVIGVPVVLLALALWLHRQPVRRRQARTRHPWLWVLPAPVLGGLAALSTLPWTVGLLWTTRTAVIVGMQVTGFFGLLTCLAWRLRYPVRVR